MKEIKTQEDLKNALNSSRSVVMYGKPDCLHCTIVRNCIESIEKQYPLINFHFTEDRDIANRYGFDAFPVLVFYENGCEQGRLIGSSKIIHIKEMLNIWFLKD